MAKFTNKLKELRERADLSQSALAKRIGSFQPRVADWEKQPDEKGYRQIPIEKAILAAEALDVPLWKLRPDILGKDSVEPLMEGLSEASKKEIRKFINFTREQEKERS